MITPELIDKLAKEDIGFSKTTTKPNMTKEELEQWAKDNFSAADHEILQAVMQSEFAKGTMMSFIIESLSKVVGKPAIAAIAMKVMLGEHEEVMSGLVCPFLSGVMFGYKLAHAETTDKLDKESFR